MAAAQRIARIGFGRRMTLGTGRSTGGAAPEASGAQPSDLRSSRTSIRALWRGSIGSWLLKFVDQPINEPEEQLLATLGIRHANDRREGLESVIELPHPNQPSDGPAHGECTRRAGSQEFPSTFSRPIHEEKDPHGSHACQYTNNRDFERGVPPDRIIYDPLGLLCNLILGHSRSRDLPACRPGFFDNPTCIVRGQFLCHALTSSPFTASAPCPPL